MNSRTISNLRNVGTVAAALMVSTAVQAGILLDPTPYLQTSDSPWASLITAGTVVVETFEDGDLDAGLLAGTVVAASAGAISQGNSGVDSVDGDDGAINNSSLNGAVRGKSWLRNAGEISFTFTGTLPTHAGVVWTDGPSVSSIRLEAYDESGVSMGIKIGGDHSDSVFTGTTAEDRFYGAVNEGGISKITLRSNVDGTAAVDLDHLQWGFAPVPEPSTYATIASMGLLGFAAYRRRFGKKA